MHVLGDTVINLLGKTAVHVMENSNTERNGMTAAIRAIVADTGSQYARGDAANANLMLRVAVICRRVITIPSTLVAICTPLQSTTVHVANVR